MTKGKLSIIVADDVKIYREIICQLLKEIPFVGKIRIAQDGMCAINLLEKEICEVILLNINMQPTDILKTTEIIRKRFPEVKIIGLSMNSDDHHILDFLERSSLSCLVKSTDKDELEKALLAARINEPYFSHEISLSLIKKLKSVYCNRNILIAAFNPHQEKLREIIYLICFGKKTRDIARMMCLSCRTIEQYRSEILEMTKCSNMASVVRYGIENGIYQDEKLRKKFNRDYAD